MATLLRYLCLNATTVIGSRCCGIPSGNWRSVLIELKGDQKFTKNMVIKVRVNVLQKEARKSCANIFLFLLLSHCSFEIPYTT